MKKTNVIIDRWKANSPAFFKKAQKYAVTIGGSLLAMVIINRSFSLGIDPTVISVLSYGACICAGIAGTAKLTKEDPQS